MMHDFSRAERVGAEMRRELAELLRDEVKDPGLGMVTLQEVRVSRDLAHAKVFFTVMGEDADGPSARALRRAAAFLRRRIGHSMRLRVAPELEFVYDRSVEDGQRLSALIDKAVADDHHGESDKD